jgi:hypothetical protein
MRSRSVGGTIRPGAGSRDGGGAGRAGVAIGSSGSAAASAIGERAGACSSGPASGSSTTGGSATAGAALIAAAGAAPSSAASGASAGGGAAASGGAQPACGRRCFRLVDRLRLRDRRVTGLIVSTRRGGGRAGRPVGPRPASFAGVPFFPLAAGCRRTCCSSAARCCRARRALDELARRFPTVLEAP